MLSTEIRHLLHRVENLIHVIMHTPYLIHDPRHHAHPLLKTANSCGSEMYCAWSSIIHKGHWSDFNKVVMIKKLAVILIKSRCIVPHE